MIVAQTAKMVIAVMIIQSNPSNPSPIELAGRTHRNWFIVSIAWLLVAGVVTALFAWLVWRAGNRQQELATSDANARIEEAKRGAADALRDAGTANQRAGEANAEAAKANEHAQKLEGDNLQLRTDLEAATAESRTKQAELAKEQSKLAEEQRKTAEAQREAAAAQLALQKHLDEVAERQKPRTLTAEKRAKMLEILSRDAKGTIVISFAANDNEALNLANQIAEVLVAAGWKVTPGSAAFEAATPRGLGLFVHDNTTPGAGALQHGLTEVGFPAEGFVNSELPAFRIGLFVGPKP